MLNLNNKIAVVSGCGSIGSGFGNGRAISTLLARQGAKVFGTDINGKWYEKHSFLRLLALKKLGWRDIHATTEFEGEEITLFALLYVFLLEIIKNMKKQIKSYLGK